MSRSQRQYSFNFGRVFFPGEANPIPSEIRFQPLGNHVDNVISLVNKWCKSDFPSASSFARVLEAAEIHDVGKPQRFEIQAKTTKLGKFKKYIYSFRGHRYLAKSDKDAWVEALAIGHHDFSVEDICSQVYELKKEQKYADILIQEPLAYARELYILEMCDQIEAELACRVFDDENQADSRTFMDFTIAPDESDDTKYFIDPWRFEDSNPIELTFKSWVMHSNEIDKDGELEKCIQDGREESVGKILDRIVKTWWHFYQGRIADQLRPNIYAEIQKRDSSNQPYLLITTSAIEVGCDLNAEVLISEICSPENLIQRAGRCNRKGNTPNAKVIAIGDSIPKFSNSLDETGWQIYQKTLESLSEFNAQKIGECISVSEQVDDYRVIELFSMLHDYVYGADLTCKHTHEKGLIVTRSWTPSVTLIYKDGSKNPHKIKVPIDRLIKNDGNDFANTYVLEHYYNQENTCSDERELGWGCAYSKDIVLEIHKNQEGAEICDGKREYSYNPELGFVELPGVFIKLRATDFDEKLLCKHNDRKSAIITYTKALKTKTD